MQVVILCGGMGFRLREETETRPKPMVEIAGQPILWHIMKGYAHYGYRDFVLLLGYKGEVIKNYFLNYRAMNLPFTVDLARPGKIQFHGTLNQEPWKVTMVDTGVKAMTGARLKRAQPYIRAPEFMLTYGDGVTDLKIDELVKFHKTHGKIGTVTGVSPISRFGELRLKKNSPIVQSFDEKPMLGASWINGGFFVFKQKFFQYLSDLDECTLEGEPLERLAKDGQMAMHQHRGFWQCMDTYRDKVHLETLWNEGNARWKTWKDN
ncbi:MAG: glucose-1-phosphate cytidylyltransferase [Elusimicrobia bacterium]|nr:glucose-1-phosphate cytidylyltransferase [Elusimicrobiota bacterium]